MPRSAFIVIIILIAWAGFFSGKNDVLPAEMLTAGRWNLRYEALDANGNGQLDKSERTDVREAVSYQFNEGGTGIYQPGISGGAKSTDITWQLADSSRKLMVMMQGATYAYRIYELSAKKLILETKTIDGRGWEEYSHK